MEKLDRAQNAQFSGLKTWGQGGPGSPRPPGSASATAGYGHYRTRALPLDTCTGALMRGAASAYTVALYMMHYF